MDPEMCEYMHSDIDLNCDAAVDGGLTETGQESFEGVTVTDVEIDRDVAEATGAIATVNFSNDRYALFIPEEGDWKVHVVGD